MTYGKIVWSEGSEIRSLKNVEFVDEDNDFITVRTPASEFSINKKNIIKIEKKINEVRE